MKKIVALVLSLVMVLGLATTAFAATTSTGSVATTSVTPVKATVYSLAAAGGSMAEVDTDVQKIELTTTTGRIDNDVPMYVPNVYVIDGERYIEVAKAGASHALKNNGAMIYLFKTTAAVATSIVMDTLVVPADDEVDCGDGYLGTAPVPYYVSGDDVYVAGATKGAELFAYYNGEFVGYTAAPKGFFKAHDFDMNTVIVKDTDVKGVKVPVSVECADCEKTFKVVNALAFDNTWVEFVDYQNFDAKTAKDYAGKYFVVLETVAADAPATEGDKVESAETFDAGIAMYVGMSVMAAAGSAVVLKKKD